MLERAKLSMGVLSRSVHDLERLLLCFESNSWAGENEMTLESGKTLGGVGAILLVVGSFVPFLSLVGIILMLIGMKNLAEHYKDDSIYRNALYGFIFGIVGIVAAAFVLVALLFGGSLFGLTIVSSGAGILAIIGAVILILVVVFIFYLLEAIYFKKAFDSLAEKSGERLFGTAGLLLLIGAILTIIVVGLIIIFVAWILAIVAFFSIKTPTTQPPAPPPPLQTA